MSDRQRGQLGWALSVAGPLLALLLGVATLMPVGILMPLLTLNTTLCALLGGPGPGFASVILGGLATAVNASELGAAQAFPSVVALLVVGLLTLALCTALSGARKLADSSLTTFEDRSRAVRDSELRMRSIVDATVDGLITIDHRGMVESFNPAAQRIFGYSSGEVIGRNIRMLMPEPDHSQHDQYLDNYRRTGVRKIIGAGRRVYGRRKDGSTFPMDLAVSEVMLKDRRIFTGLIRDVTEAVNAEQALEDSRQHLHNVLDSLFAFVGVLTPEGVLIEVNRAALQAAGLAREQVLGRHFAETYWWAWSPEVQGRLREAMARAAAGEPSRYDTTIRLADAQYMIIDFMLAPMVNTEGRVTHLIPSAIDVTDRKRVEDELRESEARFRQLADSMPQIVWSSGADGKVDWFNDRWYELTGLSRGERGNEPWIEVLHPEDRGVALRAWAESLRTGRTYEVEYRFRVAQSGEYRWHLGRALPIRDELGRIIRWFGTATEIDDQKRLQAEREQFLTRERNARAEAERANRMKDEFLATISHELRTPLNAMLGWAQLLRRSPLEGTVAQGVEIIERNARIQAQLVEDLLDMSRIISGKMRLNIRQVDLLAVIEAALEAVRPAAQAKEIRLQRALDPMTGPVRGDAARLQQVIWNLLSNAIKFTPKGGWVSVQLERAGSSAAVHVKDSGQGISPDFLPHMFNRFSQADSSAARQHGGLGLGLSIVRHLVELHGGTVEAQSPGPGQGATFSVSLPVSAAGLPEEPGPRLQPAQREPGRQLRGIRVLMVDDQPDARELVSRLLREAEAEVLTAASGGEALQSLERIRPDVLISDIGMPGMDGYEFMRRVRELADAPGHVPAVALTAFARDEDRRAALESGYQMHVPKPVEPEQLISVVAQLAGRATRPAPGP